MYSEIKCDFVEDTDFEPCCTLHNKVCDPVECDILKYGVGKEDIERDRQEQQEIWNTPAQKNGNGGENGK